jgi:hypothetical protein
VRVHSFGRPYFAVVDRTNGDMVIGRGAREIARLRLGFPTTELEVLDFIGESQNRILETGAIGGEHGHDRLGRSPRSLSGKRALHGRIAERGFSYLQANKRLKFLSKAHFRSPRRRGRS